MVNKKEENVKVENVVTEAEQTSIVAVPETEVTNVDLDTYDVTKSNNSVAKNILTGVGISVGIAAAIYGLYELGKKGYGLFKKKREERKSKIGNGLDHPEYEYKKVDDSEGDESKDVEASYKGKRPIGFHYGK